MLKRAMNNELSFIDELTGASNHGLLNYNNYMTQNIGNLFVDSLEAFQKDKSHQVQNAF